MPIGGKNLIHSTIRSQECQNYSVGIKVASLEVLETRGVLCRAMKKPRSPQCQKHTMLCSWQTASPHSLKYHLLQLYLFTCWRSSYILYVVRMSFCINIQNLMKTPVTWSNSCTMEPSGYGSACIMLLKSFRPTSVMFEDIRLLWLQLSFTHTLTSPQSIYQCSNAAHGIQNSNHCSFLWK